MRIRSFMIMFLRDKYEIVNENVLLYHHTYIKGIYLFFMCIVYVITKKEKYFIFEVIISKLYSLFTSVQVSINSHPAIGKLLERLLFKLMFFVIKLKGFHIPLTNLMIMSVHYKSNTFPWLKLVECGFNKKKLDIYCTYLGTLHKL